MYCFCLFFLLQQWRYFATAPGDIHRALRTLLPKLTKEWMLFNNPKTRVHLFGEKEIFMYSLVKKRFQAASPLSDYEQTIKTILIRYIQASGIEDANWCNIIEFLTFMITEMINFDSLHPEKDYEFEFYNQKCYDEDVIIDRQHLTGVEWYSLLNLD